MSEHFHDMPRVARLYWVTLFCLSIPVFVCAVPFSHSAIVPWLVVIFAVASIVKPIPHPYGGIVHPISGIVLVTGLLWEPQDALLGVGVGCLLGLLVFRRTELWKAGSNAVGWSMGALAAAIVAHLVLRSVSSFSLSLVLAAMLSGGTRFLTNQIIFSLSRSLRFGHPFFPHLRHSLASGLVDELFPMPLIIILAGTAFLLPAAVWRLIITAAYIPVLPVPRRRCDSSPESQGRSQATTAMVSEFPRNPAAALRMGAGILASAEMYDNTYATLSPAIRAAALEVAEGQPAVLEEGEPDPLIVPIVVSVGNELRAALADKSA